MPASTYHTSGTGRSSPYAEYEEDELIDLQFCEDPAQAYLSLGLTPLSQIDNFPASNDLLDNGGGSEGLGFFPSMPPPVSPMSSVFSLNNTGIPVDSPFNINTSSSGGERGMVMPDAYLADTTSSRRSMGSRKGKLDLNAALSQGYAMTLETVPEQSGSLDVDNGYGGHIGIITNGNAESSSDSFEGSNERDNLFPSADIGGSNLSLTRQRGVRKKSGTRRGSDYLAGDVGMSFLNKDFDGDVDLPVKMDRHGSISPSSEDKFIRQRAREKIESRELAKQRELQRQRVAEDDRRKRLLQEQRGKTGSGGRDYGSTRSRETSSNKFQQSGFVSGYQRRLSREGGTTFDQQQRYQREQQLTDGSIVKRYEQLTTL